jgi:acyl-CoA dehydrogenase
MAVSFELSEEQQMMKDEMHTFAKDVIRPQGRHYDETAETPYDIIQEATKIGLYSWEGVAGMFGDPTGLMFPVVNEELAWGDAGINLAIFGTTLGLSGITGRGTPEQIGKWAPECFGTANDIHFGAYCVTEAEAGSDLSAMKTMAKKDGDDWVLNGRKYFITNGGLPKTVHVVVATVDPDLGTRGQASFVVPPGTPGLEMGHKETKMGIRASHTAEVLLDDCRVPSDCLLGGEERLKAQLEKARKGESSRSQAAMGTLEGSRPIVGSQAVGIARAAFEYALDYAKERSAFGSPIAQKQQIAYMLADMKLRVDAARLLVWRASWMGRAGKTFEASEGSMSKLAAADAAVFVTQQAIQILGGHGYVADHPVEQWHRDSLVYKLFEGTDQILWLLIASAITNTRIR